MRDIFSSAKDAILYCFLREYSHILMRKLHPHEKEVGKNFFHSASYMSNFMEGLGGGLLAF